MNKKILFMVLILFTLISLANHYPPGNLPQEKQIKTTKMSRLQPYKFDIQGIKRIITTPTKIKCQVQYYISPNYPKPCFISAYIPNKSSSSPKFSYLPAGRLPNGVPKGQKHFTDNITFEANFNGRGTFTSKTIEVVIYDSDKNLKSQIINWGQTWGKKSPTSRYRFDIQGIKAILTTPTKVKFQVQYYISPYYPKPCFISAYIPNKSSSNPKFSYSPAGRLPNGVPKGQKHFTDNIAFEVNYLGTEPYISRTMEVVIYYPEKNLKLQLMKWGHKWGIIPPPSEPDLIISAITVSKYNPYVKTTFTIHVKNQGGTACNATDVNVWLYKLLPNGTEPSTSNEYWSGTIPGGGGTIGPGQTKTWSHDKYEFMVEGNWRVKAKINQYKNQTESNYNNNSFTYNFPIPN